jgi:hypothetical protein
MSIEVIGAGFGWTGTMSFLIVVRVRRRVRAAAVVHRQFVAHALRKYLEVVFPGPGSSTFAVVTGNKGERGACLRLET